MGWAQRLKRVFSIHVERCDRSGAAARIIVCIENSEVIEKLLRPSGSTGAQELERWRTRHRRGGRR